MQKSRPGTGLDRNVKDDYEFLKELGRGSFSIVQEAVHKRSGKRAAIKVVDKMSLDDVGLRRVRTEIFILKHCNHPNVVQLYDSYEDRSKIFIVLELLQGGELFDRIVARKRYTEKEASQTIKTLTEAVHYLHEHGFVHRDLKPENIIYATKAEDSVFKIVDFGLARCISKSMDTPCGTVGYCAPEVVNETVYDKSIDLWSIGVLAYILISGHPPFVASNDTKLCELIRAGEFQFPDKYFRKVSKECKSLIANLLRVNSRERLTGPQVLNHPWIVSKTLTTELGTPKALQDHKNDPDFKMQTRMAIAMQRMAAGPIRITADLTQCQTGSLWQRRKDKLSPETALRERGTPVSGARGTVPSSPVFSPLRIPPVPSSSQRGLESVIPVLQSDSRLPPPPKIPLPLQLPTREAPSAPSSASKLQGVNSRIVTTSATLAKASRALGTSSSNSSASSTPIKTVQQHYSPLRPPTTTAQQSSVHSIRSFATPPSSIPRPSSKSSSTTPPVSYRTPISSPYSTTSSATRSTPTSVKSSGGSSAPVTQRPLVSILGRLRLS